MAKIKKINFHNLLRLSLVCSVVFFPVTYSFAYESENQTQEYEEQASQDEPLVENGERSVLSLPSETSRTKFYFGKDTYNRQTTYQLPEGDSLKDEQPAEEEGSDTVDSETSPEASVSTGGQSDVPAVTYDIDIEEHRASVKEYINFFSEKMNDKFGVWLERSSNYIPMMKKIFRDNDLPEDLVYLSLIESGFNPYAFSRAKAAGPWQFIRGTALQYGLKIDTWVDERRDPEKATIAAAKYLKDLYGMFNSWPLAMAAYNAGEGKIGRAIKNSNTKDFWAIRKSPSYIKPETKNYVPQFMAGTIVAKNPEKYGFKVSPHKEWEYDSLTVTQPADLRVIAEILGITYQELKDINPELRNYITPLNRSSYTMRLPHGTKDKVLEAMDKITHKRHEKLVKGRPYKVKKGDTVYRIAKRENITVDLLLEINNLTHKSRLKKGDTVYLPYVEASEKVSKDTDKTAYKNTKKKHITYKVKKGDTLAKIAKNFNVSLKNIRVWNKIWDKHIQPGDKILVYVK